MPKLNASDNAIKKNAGQQSATQLRLCTGSTMHPVDAKFSQREVEEKSPCAVEDEPEPSNPGNAG